MEKVGRLLILDHLNTCAPELITIGGIFFAIYLRNRDLPDFRIEPRSHLKVNDHNLHQAFPNSGPISIQIHSGFFPIFAFHHKFFDAAENFLNMSANWSSWLGFLSTLPSKLLEQTCCFSTSSLNISWKDNTNH